MVFQLLAISDDASCAARSETIIAPTGIPQYIKPTARPRFFTDTDSDASAIRLGIAAPNPAPAKKRTNNNE